MNFLVDPGMLPVSELKDEFDEFSKENELFIVSQHTERDSWDEVNTRYSTFNYSLFDELSSCQKEIEIRNYTTIVSSLLNDHRTMLIAERVGKLKLWSSVHNAQKELEKVVFNMINFLVHHSIDAVLFQATPHGLYEWLLGNVAEGLNLKVVLLKTSPIPWRYWLVQGIDAQIPLRLFSGKDEVEDKYLKGFIETNLADYKDAIPDYEKKRLESRKGNYWSWKNELDYLYNNPSPRLLQNIFYKKKLYNTYESLCDFSFEKSTKNLVFLMHYQPERTTLPEGGLYNQQWLLIRSLSLSLPKDWTLYVKEHPSTFTNTKFVPLYRDPQFYTDVVNLSNVELVPLEVDIFDLIDNSNGIATLTGTVGVQALIRGKPVIVFGHANYTDAFGAFKVLKLQDIKNALDIIENIDVQEVRDRTQQFLEQTVSTSVSHIDTSVKEDFGFYKAQNRINGHLKLLKGLLSSSDISEILQVETKSQQQ